MEPVGFDVQTASSSMRRIGRRCRSGGTRSAVSEPRRIRTASLLPPPPRLERQTAPPRWITSGSTAPTSRQRRGSTETSACHSAGQATTTASPWRRPGTGWTTLTGYISAAATDTCRSREPTGSSPPRFMHIGLAVTNLDDIIRRLDTRGIAYRAVDGPIGRQLYLNDLDGDAALGMNVELVHYRRRIARPSRFP